MPQENRPSLSDQNQPTINHNSDDTLTQAQREFAKMLGALLARRWNQSGNEPPPLSSPEAT